VTTVDAARSSALRIAAERDALPGRVSAAMHRIDELRDSLLSAVTARHAALRAELEAAAERVDAALAAELAASDELSAAGYAGVEQPRGSCSGPV